MSEESIDELLERKKGIFEKIALLERDLKELHVARDRIQALIEQSCPHEVMKRGCERGIDEHPEMVCMRCGYCT